MDEIELKLIKKVCAFMKSLSKKYTIEFFILLFVSVITSFILYQLYSAKESQQNLAKQQIIQEAKAHFKSMENTRLWNSKYGGVYVKSTDGIKPNSYLEDNHIVSEKNETLVKINPAWMTRQISELSNKQGEYYFKISSLKPLNPLNKPDKFETEALEYFDAKPQEKYFYRFSPINNNFDFMGSIEATKSCIECHKVQGYKVGDISGGIRVSIPTEFFFKQMQLLEDKTTESTLIVVLGALITLMILLWLIELFYKRQLEIEKMNEILEKKVVRRTRKLEQLVSHEQHLKGILKIITEVNEMLISSYSAQAILENSAKKLAENEAYSLVLAGLVKGDIVDIICKSSPNSKIIEENILSLNEKNSSNYTLNAIQTAIELKHSIIEKIPTNVSSKEFNKRVDDSASEWLMVLPLIHGLDEEANGMLCVFCSREEGFESEEIRILEKMANDISIALYSHKQRDTLLNMEQEKIANYEETILAFVHMIEQRDTYTAGHTIRVAEYCSLIADEMEFTYEERHKLEKAAILHDIGKVATPDAILLKPGKLTFLEYDLIKQHSEVGAQMLERIVMYKDLANIIRYHHARYDGKGYPRTSNPDDVPMSAHIMSVADAFDALTTNRIYKPRKTIEEAFIEIQVHSGTQFHPKVVQVAIEVLKNIDVLHTTQLPSSALEQRRMAYFFQDLLTGLYNEDYLKVLLDTSEHIFRCLNIIDIHNFSAYNQKFGWQKGSELLIEIAQVLKKEYPQSTIIRYHGDDFVLLNSLHVEIDIDTLSKESVFSSTGLEINIRHYEIDEYFTFEAFLDKENF